MTALPWRCFACRAIAQYKVWLGTQSEPKHSCRRHLAAAVDEVSTVQQSTYVHVEKVSS